jgi:hypothetical protein
MISAVLLVIMIIGCWGEGIRRLVKYFKLKNVDKRPFSLSRFLTAADGFNPIEEMIIGIIGLILGCSVAYLFGADLILFFFG